MKINSEVKKVIEEVYEKSKPVSIFVYGSRARKDYKKDSDYEIGILYKEDKKWSRRDLSKLHTVKGLNLYPFIYEDFIKFRIDTPFPNKIYMRELITGASTIKGKDVIGNMKPPPLKLSDLQETAVFQVAYALAAVLSSREKDWITTSIEFTKSVFFGTRVLVILEKGVFPLSYDEILNESEDLGLESEYQELIDHAMQVRGGMNVDTSKLYTNISYQNQIVLQKVKEQLDTGDKVILR